MRLLLRIFNFLYKTIPLLHKTKLFLNKTIILVTKYLVYWQEKKEIRANNNSQYSMVQKKYMTQYLNQVWLSSVISASKICGP